MWRYGALFEREGCTAEVIQTSFSGEGNKDISVRVVGRDYRKKELLTIIGNEIEAIHRKSFRHISFKILIPCTTAKCASSGNPKLFPLDELNKLAGYGDTALRCTECGEKEDLPIYVQDDSKRQQMENELELVKKALEEIKKVPKAEAKESKPLRRIKQFIEKLENADTNIGKVIKTIDNGIEYARKFAGYYNDIAQWCGLPQVPKPFTK
ncbi:MAG: hypothetical protein FJ264_08550 [Planctomycetes bacterium]|nr:hypothetical protein [Planctomycetota bacterium]